MGVMTAPLAIIKVDGLAIGKMKDIRINENIRRAEITGLGTLTPSELAALGWSGSLTCDAYLLDFKKSLLPGGLNRSANTVNEWSTNVLLQEDGITLDIYREVATGVKSATGLLQGKLTLFVSVPGMFINADSMNISEGQAGGRNQSFQYLYPILDR
jgi:hypothetical protein